MTTSPILEELHQIREQFAARFNYDVAAMIAFLRAQQQQEEDYPIVSFSRQQEEAEDSTIAINLERAA